jgi:hypothetical protein
LQGSWYLWLGLRAVGMLALVACMTLADIAPADAQFWGPWNSRPSRPQQRSQPSFNPFGGFFGGSPPAQKEAPVDYSRAPSARGKPDPNATMPIVVMGDSMADWLAYGLEDAFSETPEIAIIRKHRTYSGLIRYEPRRDTEWAQVAKDIIAADKPKFIVMMIGLHDRQVIREKAPAPAPSRSGAKRGSSSHPPTTADLERRARQSAAEQNAELKEEEATPAEDPADSEPQRSAASRTGPFEFRSEHWEASYIKRIDATIAALKTANVPVFWVGLPPMRSSRVSADSTYLNELYRQRAEKAGIVYVDVWDGFADSNGAFSAHGPDFEGQTRRLRAGDGIHFTKYGARKLAHYVEREIQRTIANRALPVALPTIEPAPATPGGKPGGPAQRPLVGPVVPLTVLTTGSNELLGGARARAAPSDPIATRVLTKGETIPAPSGRADDFSWPRGSNVAAQPSPTEVATPSEPAAKPEELAKPALRRAGPSEAASGKTKEQPSAAASNSKAGEPKQPVQRRLAPRNSPRPPGSIRPSASIFPFFR